MKQRFLSALLVLLLAGLSVPLVGADPVGTSFVWLDPSAVPWIPTPTVGLALVPTSQGQTCTGASHIATGPRPSYVEDLNVQVSVSACILQGIQVRWTINDVTYSGAVDAATGAVTEIHKVAQNPDDYAGAGGAVPLSSTDYAGGTDVPTPCGTHANQRTSHTVASMWSSTGTEHVKSNFNWAYGTACQSTTYWNTWCEATDHWHYGACYGTEVEGYQVTAHGEFESNLWPRDQHSWDTTDTVQPDETSTGTCQSSGDMPWFYTSGCDNGPGNV